VRVEAHDRKRLEQLCRYITRPALSDERVQLNAAGQVELKLKTPWRDGTTHLVVSPLEFMQRLAAVNQPAANLGSQMPGSGRSPAYVSSRWPSRRFMKLGFQRPGTRHRLHTLPCSQPGRRAEWHQGAGNRP